MSKKDQTKVNMEIVRHACAGKTIMEIAKLTKMSRSAINHRLSALRASGLCPSTRICRHEKPDGEYYAKQIEKNAGKNISFAPMKREHSGERIEMGTISIMIGTIGRDLCKELAKEIPDGLTIAEYAASIIKDYLLDKQEKA